MKIGTVSNVNAFKGTQEVSATTSPNEKKDIKEVIKDNKGKIAIGLGALAAIGIATVAIATRKKIPSELSLDEFRKIGKFDKGAATVKGKPFSGVINVANKKGKYVLEYADGTLKSSTFSERVGLIDNIEAYLPLSKKVYSNKDGVKTIEKFSYGHVSRYNENGQNIGGLEWLPSGHKTIITDNKIVTEHKSLSGEILQNVVEKQQDGTWKKTIQEIDFYPDETFKNKNYSRRYILTKDEAGNVIAKKPVYTRKPVESSGEPVLRQTKKYTDKDGNNVVETLKNGKPYAKQTTRVADDGSKQIVVEYLDKGSRGYKKIIDITKDGRKTVHSEGKRLFTL